MSSTLDSCLVLHRNELIPAMLKACNTIAYDAGMQLRAMLLLTRSGDVDQHHARTTCAKLGIELVDCRQFDDTFFDFSAYAEAARVFYREGGPGVLFVNDTLVVKHHSAALRRYMSRALSTLHGESFAFPVMLGPFRHSEFSIGDGTSDEFAATFMFYLNSPALPLLWDVVSALPVVVSLLRDGGLFHSAVDEAQLRFCRVHAPQLRARYAGGPNANELLTRKLSTAYAERALSRNVKSSGVLWYVAGGLAGRLVVPVQAATARLLRHLRIS
jgi:hypothetical protein